MKSHVVLFCLGVLLAGCKPQVVRTHPIPARPWSTNTSPGIVLHTGMVAMATEMTSYEPAPEMTNLYDVTYMDAPIVEIVRGFAKVVGANIIAHPNDLEGYVTVRLTEVQWRPALASILDMHNLDLVEKTPGSGVYSVVRKEPGTPPPYRTTVLLFTNREQTIDIANAVREIWGSNKTARVAAVPSCNAIILEGTEYSIYEIKRIVELIAPDKRKQ